MKYILSIITVLFLSACGGSDSNPELPITAPDPIKISSLNLVDASGKPLANASISVNRKSSGVSALALIQSTLSTDEGGKVVLTDLDPGTYTLTITIDDITVTTQVEIKAGNASDSAIVPAPLDLTANGYVELENTVLAAISGVVYAEEGIIEGAEVSISGGSITNGAIATDITDEHGRYSLIINIGLNSISSNDLKKATLRVFKEGYVDINQSTNLNNITSLVGHNLGIKPTSAPSNSVVYSESFDITTANATCGEWIGTSRQIIFDPLEDLPPVDAGISTAAWHSHSAHLNIQNQAYRNDLVLLAPDDSSAGYIPDPYSGKACWYGQAAAGTGQGNFLGTITNSNGGAELEGGTSDGHNKGSLTSPTINLSNVKGPLALTFRTFWEIESVNPNDDGYDLMLIEISTDNGETWQNIARLNPLSDPTYGDSYIRAPMPFSNRGFNRAPVWLSQEPIDISKLAGKSQAKIRFTFRTVDNVYNGFRGWLIDEVQIVRKAGTFPRYYSYEEWDDDDCLNDQCCENDCIEAASLKSKPARTLPERNLLRKVAR